MDNNKILLISDSNPKTSIRLNGSNAYNNGVKMLNELTKTLYSNRTYGKARSINIEDIEKYSNRNPETSDKYGQTKIFNYSSLRYPNRYKEEKWSGVDVYDVKESGLEVSEEGEVITGDSSASYITMKENYYRIEKKI